MGRQQKVRHFQSFTKSEIKRILFAYDSLIADGWCQQRVATKYEVTVRTLRKFLAMEDELFTIPGPWQGTHLEKTWQDMPGFDIFSKRCNFALWRRGYDVFQDTWSRLRRNKQANRVRRKANVKREPEVEVEGLIEIGPDLMEPDKLDKTMRELGLRE